MKAKEYLSRAYRIDCRINSKLEQVQRMRALAEKATVGYGSESVSHSRNPTSMEDIIMRIFEAEKALNEQIDELVSIKEEIQQSIDLIPDVDCRVLLEARYLAMKTWQEICDMMNLCRTQVYKLHARGLKMIETVLRTREAVHEKETCS